MDELTYNFATTPVSSAYLKNAQDQYLYITARLSDEDQIKFWNWVNTVKTGDEIKVPIIVRLQGTNAEIAKELIDNSGMPILSAVQFQEAADQVKAALS